MQSLNKVFEGIEKLKDGALKLKAQQDHAVRRSKELYQKSDMLGNMAIQTLSKWNRNTGQPKVIRPKIFHKRSKQKAEVLQDSSDDSTESASAEDVGEEFSDSMEWETDAQDGQMGMDG
ncbi:hypothetical protein E0Z10_g3765 [Xylaria hypoxylon]|uniref:Uncharacterized protein n=1 Tax=Xylaria hypoxylon TaxID=37992 RepID=A0A4Z0Z0R1_9PEZI|nr:hypothetical protein E0Z10_g3765 [Xylaria hypoxylon]